MNNDAINVGVAILGLIVGFLVGMCVRQPDVQAARTEGSRTCQRTQPGYVRQSVASCIQEVQQKAQRCQELATELR